MAHMMKHTKASCGHMFAHFDRKAEHISNENLDRTKTHLNYNLATHQQMDQGEFVRKRCSEVRCINRKDVNVMITWVVTAPKDLPEMEHRAFFQASYDFLKKRYGQENIISAYVHMDEITPHMHFAFVPVVRSRKKNRKNPGISEEIYKVSAKECVSRYDLQRFHEDLQRYVSRELGHEVNILNEATKDGNRSIKELKRQSAAERLQEANEKASEIVSEAQEQAQTIKDSLIPLNAEYEEKKAYIQQVNKHLKELESAFERIKNENKHLKEKVKKAENKANSVEHEVRTSFIEKINKVLRRLPKDIAEPFWNEWQMDNMIEEKTIPIPPIRSLSENVEKENGDMEWER